MAKINGWLFLFFGLTMGGLFFYPLGRISGLQNVDTNKIVAMPTEIPSKFTVEDQKKAADFDETMKRCGDIPEIKGMKSPPGIDNAQMKTEAVWSPNCQKIVWSVSPRLPAFGWWDEESSSSGKALSSDFGYKTNGEEGIFMYDACTKKSKNLFRFKTLDDTYGNIEWIDNIDVKYEINGKENIYSVN